MTARPGPFLSLLLAGLVFAPAMGSAQESPAAVRTGAAAYGGWETAAPGVRRLITPADMPPPYATGSAGNAPDVVARPAEARLHVPPGLCRGAVRRRA